jgi:hypothetical protein
MKKAMALVLVFMFLAIIGCDSADDTTKPVVENNAPGKPFNPGPENNASDQLTSLVLSWQCSDPDANDVLTYDVYFGATNPPDAAVSVSQSDTFFAVSGLDLNTTYYWKISAKDQHNASTTSPIWVFTTGSSEIPIDGLIAYYPFTGNANDESGNAHSGTVNGATLTTDRFGSTDRAYLFDGINDYISAPYSADLNTPTISISVWVKLSSLVGASQARIVNRQSTAGGIESWGVEVFGSNYSGSGNYNKFTFHSANCTVNKNIVSPTHLSASVWYHIVAINDGTTQRLYINGSLDTSDSSLGNVCASNLAPLVIGKSGPLSGFYFPGTIDDIRIYNRALNQSEIEALYQEGGFMP